MPDTRKPRPLARSARLLLHTLANAEGSVSVFELALVGGMQTHSVQSVISTCRRFVVALGGTIQREGQTVSARYRLGGIDGPTVIAAVGPVVRNPRARTVSVGERWTPELDAELMRLADAGGTTLEIATALGITTRMAVWGRLSRLRKAQTTEKGTPALGPDIVPRRPVGVTLPRVGAAYAYAAGRLLRDGVPVGARV